jgi:hypothetical protein
MGAKINFKDQGIEASAEIVAISVVEKPLPLSIEGIAHQMNPIGAPSEKYNEK